VRAPHGRDTACTDEPEAARSPNVTASSPITPDTTTGRQAGEPSVVGRAAGQPEDDSNDAIVHVFGSVRSVPPVAPSWGKTIPMIGEDLATIVSVGCNPDTPECANPALATWMAEGSVEVVNVATASAAASETLSTTVAELRAAGVEVTGYGEAAFAARSGVRLSSSGVTISIHGISLIVDDERAAGPNSPGIAGAAVLDELLEEIEALGDEGLGIVVLVDVGSLDDRAPTATQISDIQRLVDAGADAVIGHGSDFIQRFDRVGNTTVAYNLGNAVTSTDEPLRTDSAVLRLEFGSPGSACLLPTTADSAGPALDDPANQSCAMENAG